MQNLNTPDVQVTPFEQLKISTMTVLVYTNITNNWKTYMVTIPVTSIKMPPPQKGWNLAKIKKKLNNDKKNIRAHNGDIICIQQGQYFRGLRMSHKKKYWCPICQLYILKNNESKKLNTVIEEIRPLTLSECIKKRFPPDTNKILFVCKVCKRTLKKRALGTIVPFLNQATIVMMHNNVKVNIMAFKNHFKVAGNKAIDIALEVVMVLWENYIQPYPNLWSKKFQNSTEAHFRFEKVMQNVDFELGFPISRIKLNEYFNNNNIAVNNKRLLSGLEATSAPYIKIVAPSITPDNFMYNVLVYNDYGINPILGETPYRLYSYKPVKIKNVTFIAFSSSKIILSGRYDQDMKEYYEFFVQTLKTNKEKFMEIICKPKVSIKEFLRVNIGLAQYIPLNTREK